MEDGCDENMTTNGQSSFHILSLSDLCPPVSGAGWGHHAEGGGQGGEVIQGGGHGDNSGCHNVTGGCHHVTGGLCWPLLSAASGLRLISVTEDTRGSRGRDTEAGRGHHTWAHGQREGGHWQLVDGGHLSSACIRLQGWFSLFKVDKITNNTLVLLHFERWLFWLAFLSFDIR